MRHPVAPIRPQFEVTLTGNETHHGAAEMHVIEPINLHVFEPISTSLRQLYGLNVDRIWFAIAVLLSLFAAAQLTEWLMLWHVPSFEPMTRL